MKKKGFTLVELLIVIALMGLLIAIAVPSGIAISKKIKKNMLDTKIEIIEQGAVVWGQNNKSKISVGKDSCSIDEIVNDEKVSHCINKKLSELLDENALEEDKLDDIDGDLKEDKVLINPVTNMPLNDCGVEIYIKNKRVYAKYDIERLNCGYEEVEIPKIPEENKTGYSILLAETECIETSTEEIYEELSNKAVGFYDLMTLLIDYNIQDHSRCNDYVPSSDRFGLLDGERFMEANEYDLIINDSRIIKKGSGRELEYDVKVTIKSDGIILEETFNVPIKDTSGPILLNFDDGLKFFTGYDGPLMQYESNIQLLNSDNVGYFNSNSCTFDNVDGLKKFDITPILNDVPSNSGAFADYYSGGKTFYVSDDVSNLREYHLEVSYNNLDFPYDITNISEKYNNGVLGNDLSIYKILKDGKLKYFSGDVRNLNDVISNLNSDYNERISINAYQYLVNENGDFIEDNHLLTCSIENISDFNSGDCIKELQLSLIGNGYLRFTIIAANSQDYRTLSTGINFENKFNSIFINNYTVSSFDAYESYYEGLPFLDVLNNLFWVHDLAPDDYYSTRDLLKMGGYTIELSTNYYGSHDVWKFESVNDLANIDSRPLLIDGPMPTADREIWGTIPITVKITKGAFSQTLETEFDIIKDFGLYCYIHASNEYYPINSCECDPERCANRWHPECIDGGDILGCPGPVYPCYSDGTCNEDLCVPVDSDGNYSDNFYPC